MMNNQKGIVAVLTAICIAMLLGFVALAIETAHLVYTANELQDAADAGALAGAIELYNEKGTVIQGDSGQDPYCNQVAYDTATANLSEKTPVDVHWSTGENTDSDIERGHWSWGLGDLDKGFYPSDSTTVVDLWDEDGNIVDNHSS